MSTDYAGEKILTPIGRASYPAVFKENKFGRFSLHLLIPKDPTKQLPSDKQALANLKAEAMKVALMYFKVSTAKELPANFKSPFRDGDDANDEGVVKPEEEGMIVINAWTNDMSGNAVIGPNREPIIEKNEFYAGCKARAYFTPFGYSHGKNKGVSFFLGSIQKTGEGTPFSKHVSDPMNDFTAIEPELEAGVTGAAAADPFAL